MSTPDTTVWEVFLQMKQGGAHEHAGNVHAEDAEMAIQNARDVYARRGHPLSIWVVRSEDMHASRSEDQDSLFDPADDKLYRHPTFYTVPRGVREV